MSIASISSRIRRAQRNSTGATLSLEDLKELAAAGLLHRLALLEADEQCRDAGVEPPAWSLEIGGDLVQGLPREDAADPETAEPRTGRGAYSVADLAKRWACSGSMIRKMVKDGRLAKLPGNRNIRISVAEVQRYEATPG